MQPVPGSPGRGALRWTAHIGAVIAAIAVSLVLWGRAPRAAVIAAVVPGLVVLTTVVRNELKRWG